MAVDINALMSASNRKIRSKMEITFLKPFQSELPSTITAPDTATVVNKDQMANGIYEPYRRWFDIGAGPIGDGFSFISTDPDEFEIGWWSDSKSDSLGEFSVPPVNTLEYTSRTTLSVQITGDSKMINYPVDFEVQLFDGITEVYDNVVTGNTEVNWLDNIEASAITSDKMIITVNKINQPNARARIVETGQSATDLFFDDTIIDVSYLEELYYTDSDLPIGAVSSDEISIKWWDQDRRYDPLNPDSPIAQSLKKNRLVKVWFGVDSSPGVTEWYSLGDFFSYTWDIDRNNNIASVTARDTLELTRTADYRVDIQDNITLYDAFENILIDFGLDSSQYEIDTSFQSITFPYVWFEKGSHRSALQKLAKNSLANVTVRRDNKFLIEDTSPTASVEYVYSDSTNVYERRFPLALVDQVNRVEVPYTTHTYSEELLVLEENVPRTIPGSTTVTIEVVYNSFPVRDDITVEMVSGPSITINVVDTYSWGATIEFINANVSSEPLTSIFVLGYVLQPGATSLAITSDDDDIEDSGLISQTMDIMTMIQDRTYAEYLSAQILSRYSLQVQEIDINNRGHIDLPLGSRLEIEDIEYMLLSQEFSYNGGLESTVIGKKI